MSVHEDICQDIRAFIFAIDAEGVIDLSPTLLANRCYAKYKKPSDDPHVQYAAVEHYKQISRGILSSKFDVDGKESEAIQNDMFSGHLQERYPIQVKKGEQPIYRPRAFLSLGDLDWNISHFRKTGMAHLQHADALEAYRDSKAASAA